MKIFNKVKNVSTEKRNKIVGMLVIFLALLIVGYFVTNVILKKDTNSDAGSSSEVTTQQEQEQQKITDETQQSEATIKDIDTTIDYTIPDGIQKRLDVKKFDAAFKKYLEDNQFYTDNTKAVSDGILTEDFSKGYITFNLRLNNYNSNTIIVVLNNDGSYEFDYY